MKSAFTLVEVIVAIIIIGILAGIALPRFAKTVETTKAKEAKVALKQIRAGERIYRTGEGYYYPHSVDHPPAAVKAGIEAYILKVPDILSERNWTYTIDTNTADDFAATATRTSGGNENETITLDQDGPPFGGTWSP